MTPQARFEKKVNKMVERVRHGDEHAWVPAGIVKQLLHRVDKQRRDAVLRLVKGQPDKHPQPFDAVQQHAYRQACDDIRRTR